MYRLTISITDEEISFKMDIGLIKKSYRIKNIVSCKAIHYTSFCWGIRFRPGVTLFNVSGNKAIELIIEGKSRKVLIGTDSPDELVEFIRSKLDV